MRDLTASIIFGLLLGLVVRESILWILNQRHQRKVERVDSRLREGLNKPGQPLSPQAIPQDVPEADRQLAQERLRMIVVNDSAVRNQVEAVLTEYIAPLPRYAKRAINRARFAIGVAFERHMLEHDPNTTADLIGKWVCLLERWPTLAQNLLRTPSAIQELEQAARSQPPQLSALLTRLAPAHAHDAELAALLAREPFFGAALEDLVRFEPAPETKAVAGATKAHSS